jgi:hypothetical protein
MAQVPNLQYLCLPVEYGKIANNVRESPLTAISRAFRKPKRFSDNLEGRVVFFEEVHMKDGYANIKFNGGNILSVPGVSGLLNKLDIPEDWKI